MEPIAVATHRNLPSLHPVFKLLLPHIRGVNAINTVARDVLIGQGGFADQVQQAFQNRSSLNALAKIIAKI